MTNITDIGTALENLNISQIDYNSTDILVNANNYANSNSEGWVGLLILIMIGTAIFFFLRKNRNEMKLVQDLSLLSFSLLVIIDLAFILYQYRIIYEIHQVVFLFTCYIVVCLFSLLKKERDTFSN